MVQYAKSVYGEMRCRISLAVFDMGWRQQDKLRGELWSSMQNPCTERCDVELPWVGDCKTNQICQSVDRWNGRFCLSLNSGRTVQYKHNAQSLRLFGLHDDVNDAHRAGANRLQNTNN